MILNTSLLNFDQAIKQQADYNRKQAEIYVTKIKKKKVSCKYFLEPLLL